MANPLPGEQDIRNGIRTGEYKTDPLILKALDLILSDYLVALVLDVKNYIEEKRPMEIPHARRLLEYSRSMNNIFVKVLHPQRVEETDNDLLKRIQKDKPQMHKEIQAWLKHHIGNDSQAINFILGDFIDDGNPIPVESLESRILPRSEGIETVLSALLAPLKEVNQ